MSLQNLGKHSPDRARRDDASFLLVGCDDSVAQNAAPPAPTVSAAKVLGEVDQSVG